MNGDTYRIDFVDGGYFTIRNTPQDRHIFNNIFAEDEYRLADIKAKLDTVIDIGAHIGIFAVRASRIARRILSFEAVPQNFEMLEKNISSSRCSNIEPYNLAVGKGGPMKIFISENPSAHSAFLEPEYRVGEVTINGISLDEIFTKYGVNSCDLLKIDCEGSEYEILYGSSRDTLKKIKRIRLEYHPLSKIDPAYNGKDLAKFLGRNGFIVKLKSSRKTPEKGLLFCTASNL